jgi:hypothetical protein
MVKQSASWEQSRIAAQRASVASSEYAKLQSCFPSKKLHGVIQGYRRMGCNIVMPDEVC